jgi:hypothetical protein
LYLMVPHTPPSGAFAGGVDLSVPCDPIDALSMVSLFVALELFLVIFNECSYLCSVFRNFE